MANPVSLTVDKQAAWEHKLEKITVYLCNTWKFSPPNRFKFTGYKTRLKSIKQQNL